MKEIYNEGRVVGLNAYETYVRQLLSTNPEATPMTEREWLASTVSESNSMILKVAAGTTKGFHDYALPVGSDLCACTVINAYMFEGEIQMNGSNYWATSVDSYGRLISNTGTLHPSTPGTGPYVPTMPNPEQLTPELRERATNYLKIISGLVLQPGEWVSGIRYTPLLTEQGENILTEDRQNMLLASVNDANGDQILHPDLSQSPFVRLAVAENITADVYIFLHGFVYKSVFKSGLNSATNKTSIRPQDGDFLGPTIFPWACPIMLNVTTNVMNTVNNGVIIELVE